MNPKMSPATYGLFLPGQNYVKHILCLPFSLAINDFIDLSLDMRLIYRWAIVIFWGLVEVLFVNIHWREKRIDALHQYLITGVMNSMINDKKELTSRAVTYGSFKKYI